MWENILKRKAGGYRPKETNTIKYIMRDGNFRSVDALMEEIYEVITENKKLGHAKLNTAKYKGRPQIRRFEMSKTAIQQYMTKSPDEYERRDTGNKTFTGRPIIEFRYIGG